MKAPFPWFGGKRRVAREVWSALGDVDNYVEPFAGSLAVLLERPRWHGATCETVNDADRYVANFWRALAADPEAVARHCDWPVNEADLEARHLWLVNTGRERIAAMFDDPEFFDAKVAGWWVWGINQWIGSGWCSGQGPHGKGVNRQLPHLGTAGQGVNRQLPHLGDAGRGVNRQLPHLGNAGRGVNRQLPHLGNAGQGVNRQLPHLGNAGQGVNRPDGISEAGGSGAPRNNWDRPLTQDGDTPVLAYFRALAQRLRKVRVCCGDWSRVVTDGATSYGATVGVFLDPPYSGDVRSADLYAVDDHSISGPVREWAISKGDDPRFRIVLAGYEGEHQMPATWRKFAWSSTGAYKGGGGNDTNAEVNRHLERLWFSPHCVCANASRSLFSCEQAGK